jgi:hypothetical protein
MVALIAVALIVALTQQAAQCAAPERHQFDFWIGNWRVVDASGKFQGTNRVTSEYGGCLVQEHWVGANGGSGSSFNSYMPGRRRWQQTWVDSHGLTLRLIGGMHNGSMVLSGDRVDKQGHRVIDRIAWTPLTGGRVRQHWQESADGGARWQDVFDGYYVPAK